MAVRDSRGRFVKGQTGNKKGRPKSVPVDENTSKELGDDPIETLKWLLRTAKTRAEKRQASLDLIDYVKPRLKAIEVKETRDSKIQIEWIIPGTETESCKGLSGNNQGEMTKDVTNKIIDGEVIENNSNEIDDLTKLLKEAEKVKKDTVKRKGKSAKKGIKNTPKV